jgi:hypothetical protein
VTLRLPAAFFLASAALLSYELLLTRVFAVVLFADLAHVALSLAMLGLAAGALAWHRWPGLVPADRVERTVAYWTVAQAVATIVAVVALVDLPLVPADTHRVLTWFDRAGPRFELVQWWAYVALVPLLALPPAFAGVAFAGATGRRPDRAGILYGADLLGGAAGALLFLPALAWTQGPDAALVSAGLALCAAAVLLPGWGRALVVPALAGVVLAGTSDLIRVRTSVAWSEANLLETRWTPLARIALHRQDGADTVLLDNTSASIVVNGENALDDALENPGRSLVHRLLPPGGHVAILAAAAGPEVVMARHFGHTDVDAIDIAGDVFDFADRWYPPGVDNPFADPRTHRVVLDARAAIARADRPYDIIQLLNANLLSATGLLATAWSPALLETREAYATWFAHLAPDGILSMAVNLNTAHDLPVAAAALADRGVAQPWSCLAFEGRANVLLARPRPWTAAELAQLSAVAATVDTGKPPLRFETGARLQTWAHKRGEVVVLTDDHPYADTVPTVLASLRAGGTDPTGMVYRTLLAQGGVLLVLGGVVLGVPLLGRRHTGLAGVPGLWRPVGIFACLGYGYLAVETGVIHGVVLFVGHPTYAVTTVVATMLLASGFGSLYAGRLPVERVRSALPLVLLAAVVLGLVQAWVTPRLLQGFAFGLPIGARVAAVALALAPLAFVLGIPFSSTIRIHGPRAPALVGWAWALNGWMSVLGGLVTVLVARNVGYAAATAAGLAAYAIAALLAFRSDPAH